jgi:hypothetical protein
MMVVMSVSFGLVKRPPARGYIAIVPRDEPGLRRNTSGAVGQDQRMSFEGDALRAISAVNATTTQNVNPLAGRFEVLAEPRLASPATSYLVTGTAQLDGLVRVLSAHYRSGPSRDWRKHVGGDRPDQRHQARAKGRRLRMPELDLGVQPAPV